MRYVYLAYPYTSDNPSVMLSRFEAANRLAGQLMDEGLVVFSPISHSHPIAQHLDNARDGAYWAKQDAPFLAGAAAVIVATVDGWDSSRGIQAECAKASELGLPVYFLDPSNLGIVERVAERLAGWLKIGNERTAAA
jgi:hypothetical protein